MDAVMKELMRTMPPEFWARTAPAYTYMLQKVEKRMYCIIYLVRAGGVPVYGNSK